MTGVHCSLYRMTILATTQLTDIYISLFK